MSELTSDKTTISSELKALKLLEYPTSLNELPDHIAQLTDILADSGATFSPFTLEFVRNTHNLLNGDLSLNVSSKGVEQAIRYYQAAAEGYQALLDRFEQGEFEDSSIGLDSDENFELKWRLEYAKGRLASVKGIHFLESDPIQGQNQLQASTAIFSTIVDFAGQRADYDRLFLSLGCFFHAQGILSSLQAKVASTPSEALTSSYEALKYLKKGKFVGYPDLDNTIKEIKDQISDLMISKVEKTAEACWQTGLALANEKRYKDSLKLLERGSAVYRGLQRLDNREEFVLQEKLLRVSALESHARLLMDKDKNEDAAEKFRRASFALRDVAEYVRAMDQEQLAENFETQKQFFEGMSTFARGLVFFDADDVTSAITSFKNAETILKTTQEGAKKSGNTVLLDQCSAALDQVSSYIETAAAMHE